MDNFLEEKKKNLINITQSRKSEFRSSKHESYVRDLQLRLFICFFTVCLFGILMRLSGRKFKLSPNNPYNRRRRRELGWSWSWYGIDISCCPDYKPNIYKVLWKHINSIFMGGYYNFIFRKTLRTRIQKDMLNFRLQFLKSRLNLIQISTQQISSVRMGFGI